MSDKKDPKALLKKHKKLLYSQGCSFLACVALILAVLRYDEAKGGLSEQMTLSFVLFAVVLFVVEIRLLWQWLGERKREREKAAA